jgi:hypothetical protein
MQERRREIRLEVEETYSNKPRRPHLVTNRSKGSASFLVLQGGGEQDVVRLLQKDAH